MLAPKLWFLDHLGAIVVCIFILQAAWRIALPAARKLVDTAPPESFRESIQEEIRAFPRVRTTHALRTRYVGSGVAVDFHIQVDPDITVRDGHAIAERLKSRLISRIPDLVDVVVHLEPAGETAGPDSARI
jgi:cation diffusion facilitator family transporter